MFSSLKPIIPSQIFASVSFCQLLNLSRMTVSFANPSFAIFEPFSALEVWAKGFSGKIKQMIEMIKSFSP
jgi:hypothetical protein